MVQFFIEVSLTKLDKGVPELVTVVCEEVKGKIVDLESYPLKIVDASYDAGILEQVTAITPEIPASS